MRFIFYFLVDLLQKSSGASFSSQNHDLHLRIFDGDLYDSPGYDAFHPIPSDRVVTFAEPQGLYMERPLSTESMSSTAASVSIFLNVGTASLPCTVQSKNDMAHEGRKGAPVAIFLFVCLKNSDSGDEAIWEGGLDLPGCVEMEPIIAKLAFTSSWPTDLMHEKKVYDHLTRNPFVHLPIPTCYGAYYIYAEMSDVAGYCVGLLVTSLVTGTPADRLNDEELRAVMCVHLTLCRFHSRILVTQSINSRRCEDIACSRCHPWSHYRPQYHSS
jgi:hypothetical protein